MNEPLLTTPDGGQTAAAGALVRDGTDASFLEDVIEASREVPIVVDLWAPWCGPCRTLSPVIEKAVTHAKGAVRLVKVNVDENPVLARGLRAQSIPAVYAFKDGQPVDGFVGALPESQVRAFIQGLAGDPGPSPAEALLEEAEARREAGDLAGAANLYGQALKLDSGNPKALAGLAQSYLAGGDVERARQTLTLVAPGHANDAAVRSAQAALALQDAAGGAAADTAGLDARLAANADDHEARYDLAVAHTAAGRNEQAVEALLEIIRRSRTWNDEAARKQLLTLFDALGPLDALTREGRRRLSSLLFT